MILNTMYRFLNNFPFRYPNLTLILFIVLSMCSDTFNLRFLLEGTFLILSIFTLDIKTFFLLGFVFFIHLIFFGLESGLTSLVIVYYLIYLRVLQKKYTIPVINLKLLIVILLIYFIYLYNNSIFLGRVYGFFNSPLSAGYFFAAVCIYVISKYKNLFSFLIFIISIFFGALTGSRSSVLLVISLLFEKFFEGPMKKRIIIFIILLFSISVLVYFNESILNNFDGISRAIRSNSASEKGRLISYMNWLNYDYPWYTYLIGIGRDKLGSLAGWFHSTNSLTVESSFLTIFSAYGFIGLILVILILYFTLRTKNLIWFGFFILSSVTVMMDALAVTLPVLLLIYAATNSIKTKKELRLNLHNSLSDKDFK